MNTQLAQPPGCKDGVASEDMVYLDSEQKIAELEARIRVLEEENRNLLNRLCSYGLFIRNFAQFYFSRDQQSRWCAGEQNGKPVDDDAAMAHWLQVGGPESFRNAFPTAESVMKYFVRLFRK